MKIYSWNILHKNPDLDRAFGFIEAVDFDIFCLQEVPLHFLERLQTMGAHLVSAKELDFVDGKIKNRYSVILSKYPIVSYSDFPLSEYAQSLRVKIFVLFLHLVGGHFSSNWRSLYADIEAPKFGRLRVFCLHLSVSYPRQRARELDAAMTLRDTTVPTIVCGDLNIFERARVTLLNWLLGGRLRDVFTWHSERLAMEKRFSELELQNPLRGERTHTISQSQLDHILIPQNMRIIEAKVLHDRMGSDHNPIFVECE